MNLQIEINYIPDATAQLELQTQLNAAFQNQLRERGLSSEPVGLDIVFKSDKPTQKLMQLLLDGAELEYSITLSSEVWFVSRGLQPQHLLKEADVLAEINIPENAGFINLFYVELLEEVVKENISAFAAIETMPNALRLFPELAEPEKQKFFVHYNKRALDNCRRADVEGTAELLRMGRKGNDPDEIAEIILSMSSPPSAKIVISEEYLKAISELKEKPDLYKKLKEDLFYLLGIDFPDPQIQFDTSLRGTQFRIQINDRKSMVYTGLDPDERIVPQSDSYQLPGILKRPFYNLKNNRNEWIVRQNDVDLSGDAITPLNFILMHLARAYRKNVNAFITNGFTEKFLEKGKANFPDLVSAVMERRSISFITAVLRKLVSEEISLRNEESILQSIIDFDFVPVDGSELIVFDDRVTGKEFRQKNNPDDPLYTCEFARIQLKQYISHISTRGKNSLSCYLLDMSIEKAILDGNNLNSEEFLSSVENQITVTYFDEGKPHPVLTTVDVSPVVRELCKKRFPELSILSYQELSPDLSITPVSRITMPQKTNKQL